METNKLERNLTGVSSQTKKSEGLFYARIDEGKLMITEDSRTENYGEIISQDYHSWKDKDFPWNRR